MLVGVRLLVLRKGLVRLFVGVLSDRDIGGMIVARQAK